MQHHDDFLLVEAGLGRVADDEGRRHHPLLLEADVRVHPKRAGDVEREVVIIRGARRERRLRDIGNAVLPIWRRQAVPVHQGRFVEVVFERRAVALPGLGVNTPHAVGPTDMKRRRRLAVDLDHARLGAQDDRRLPGHRRPRQGCRHERRPGGGSEEFAARETGHFQSPKPRLRRWLPAIACDSITRTAPNRKPRPLGCSDSEFGLERAN